MTYPDQIRHYYDSSQWLYRIFCYGPYTLGMHFGFWDKTTKNRYQAIINQDQSIINVGQVQSHHRVLDAGCGIGSTAIHIAQTVGAHVTGITLSTNQVKLARHYAHLHRVTHLTDFQIQDYNHTSFPDKSFDVIYGNESICYASPKTTFTKEAYRLLKPTGRLIIADGYAAYQPRNQLEKTIVNNFTTNFALKELATPQQMTAALKAAGFINIKVFNKTPAVKPSVEQFYRLATLALPLAKLAYLLPSSKAKALLRNFIALRCAGQAMRFGLANYSLHIAQKP